MNISANKIQKRLYQISINEYDAGFLGMNALSELDLGKTILSVALGVGFFLVGLTIVRSIEIPIRIYLDKRKVNKTEKQDQNKGKDGFGS